MENNSIKNSNFTINPYNYELSLTKDNSFKIEVKHCEKCFEWSFEMTNSTKTDSKNKTESDSMELKLTPELCFQILNDFFNKKISEEFGVVLPNPDPSQFTILNMKIFAKLSYQISCEKTITLFPIYFDKNEILNKRLEKNKSSIEEEMAKLKDQVNYIHETVLLLSDQVEKLTKKIEI